MSENKTTTFEEDWLEKTDKRGEKFKMWLLPNSSKSSEAVCAICSWKKISLKYGLKSIEAHSRTKKHMHVMKILREKRLREFEVG